MSVTLNAFCSLTLVKAKFEGKMIFQSKRLKKTDLIGKLQN